MYQRLYCVHVTQADLDRAPQDRLALSPLCRKLRQFFGSTCSLDGPRLIVRGRRSSLCLDHSAWKWETRWRAGLTVRPALCWLESRPALPEPQHHPRAMGGTE